MQKLPTQFNTSGYSMEQEVRNEHGAVYRQMKGGRLVSYELIRIQIAKEGEMFGRKYPLREVYPSNEMWGKEAWTLSPSTPKSDLESRLQAITVQEEV